MYLKKLKSKFVVTSLMTKLNKNVLEKVKVEVFVKLPTTKLQKCIEKS